MTKQSGESLLADLVHTLRKKPYFPSPGILWKTQKDQVNIIFPSIF